MSKMKDIYTWEYILIIILVSSVTTYSQLYDNPWSYRQSPFGQTRSSPGRIVNSLVFNRNLQNSFPNHITPVNNYRRPVSNSNTAMNNYQRSTPNNNRITANIYQKPVPYNQRITSSNNYQRLVPNNQRIIPSNNYQRPVLSNQRATPSNIFQRPVSSNQRMTSSNNYQRPVLNNQRITPAKQNQISFFNNSPRVTRIQTSPLDQRRPGSGETVNGLSFNRNQQHSSPNQFISVNQRPETNRNKLIILSNNPSNSKPSLKPPEGYKVAYCKVYNSTHQLVTYTPETQQTLPSSQNRYNGRRIVGSGPFRVQKRLPENRIIPRNLLTKYVMVRIKDYVVCSHPSRPSVSPYPYQPGNTNSGRQTDMPNAHTTITSSLSMIYKRFRTTVAPALLQESFHGQGSKPHYNRNPIFSRNRGTSRPIVPRARAYPAFSNAQNNRKAMFRYSSSRRPITYRITPHKSRSKSSYRYNFQPRRRSRPPTFRPSIRQTFSRPFYPNKESVSKYSFSPWRNIPYGTQKSQSAYIKPQENSAKSVTPVISTLLSEFFKNLQNTALSNPVTVPKSHATSQLQKYKRPNSFSNQNKNPGNSYRRTTSRPIPQHKPSTSRPQSTTSQPSSTAQPTITTRRPRNKSPPSRRGRRRPGSRRPMRRRRPHHRVVKERIRVFVPQELKKEFDQDKETRKKIEQEAFEEIKEEHIEEKRNKATEGSNSHQTKRSLRRRNTRSRYLRRRKMSTRRRRRRFTTPKLSSRLM